MIAHRFISVVMTALLLACPFLDCGKCWGMCPVQAALDSDCCHHDHDAPCDEDSDAPGRHGCPNACNEVDCICDGAIVPDVTRCSDRDVDNGFFAAPAIHGCITPQLTALYAQDQSLYRGSHFPPLLSGRDICTLVGSHLL